MTNRVNQIWNHHLYKEHLAKIEACEIDRVFCHHDMTHFLDVARIAMILNGKDEYGIEEELIYTAALLHDIGRWQQYETGEDHALVSARLAPKILRECGYTEDETLRIVSAIETHRKKEIAGEKTLNGLLYRADKLSRPCFSCRQEKNCNWKEDKKNLQLIL